MNTANKLTMLRVALIPVYLLVLYLGFPGSTLVALGIFVLASITDFVDGYIARHYNQTTDFGKFMDPLADKILVISALVCFVSLGLINPWWVLIIIAREFLVTSLRLVAADEGVVIAANKWGKVKTVSQIIAIALILAMQYAQELIAAGTLSAFSVEGIPSETVFLWTGEGLMAVTVFFTVLSGGIYLKQNWKVIGNSK